MIIIQPLYNTFHICPCHIRGNTCDTNIVTMQNVSISSMGAVFCGMMHLTFCLPQIESSLIEIHRDLTESYCFLNKQNYNNNPAIHIRCSTQYTKSY